MEKRICLRCGKHNVTNSWDKHCYSCQNEIYNQNLKQNLIDDEVEETSGEDDVICPYCGEIQENDEGKFYEEGEQIVCCGSCDKEFELETDVSYYYATRRI